MKEKIRELFHRTYGVYPQSMEMLSAHGSSRVYFRLQEGANSIMAACNQDRKENIAFLDYAKQLAQRGIKVPEILSEDLENGIYLQQDLGDTTLFEYLKTASAKEKEQIYSRIVKSLPQVQLAASRDFDYSNAYPRKKFDARSMQWDMNYFKYYFVKLADIAFDEQDLEEDFAALQNYLLQTDVSYFLFRDFQSRNIMLFDDEVFFIDFQGGRQGALQYDLATLLYDAKADLSEDLRKRLLETYIEELQKLIKVDEKEFRDKYYAYVYMRIMQTLGAYGYRGFFQGKQHFLQSIPYALRNLKCLQENKRLSIDLPCLSKVFDDLVSCERLWKIAEEDYRLTVSIMSFSYKKGYPYDATGNGGGFVFDCRALPNPGRYERYKQLTGKDGEVIAFLEGDQEVERFYASAKQLVEASIEKYLSRRFTNLCVYFGCTGGQHRSVYLAQRLANELQNNPKLKIEIFHREQN